MGLGLTKFGSEMMELCVLDVIENGFASNHAKVMIEGSEFLSSVEDLRKKYKHLDHTLYLKYHNHLLLNRL